MSLNLIAMERSEVPINRDSIKGTPVTENPDQSYWRQLKMKMLRRSKILVEE